MTKPTVTTERLVLRPLASRATAQGRVTISGRRLIRTIGGERTEEELDDPTLRAAVRTHFDDAIADVFAEVLTART